MKYQYINRMTTSDKYDALCSFDGYDIELVSEFATSVYGMKDSTLGDITYYFFGDDDIDSWIHDNIDDEWYHENIDDEWYHENV